jgi:hypothetical protein
VVSDKSKPQPLTDTATVTVIITNVNEKPLIHNLPDTLYITLPVKDSMPITYKLDVTDEDVSTVYIYTLTPDNFFNSVNQSTGLLTISDSNKFYIGDSIFNISIKVKDNGSPSQNTTGKLTIYIKNRPKQSSIQEYLLSQTSVFPNPAKDKLFIEIPEGISSAKLIITDMQGKTVLQEKVNESKSIDISALREGVYLYRLKSGKEVVTGRVVKE